MKKISIVFLISILLLFVPLLANSIHSEQSWQITNRNRDVWGPWVETQWTQEYPYNILCPLNPYWDRRCFVGIIPSSMAQIINYHKYINDASFDDDDDYYSNPIYIDDDYEIYDFPSFPELNVYLDQIRSCYSTSDELTDTLIAALNFACGVSVENQYVFGGGTLSDVCPALLNKFGYATANYIQTINASFYSVLSTDMMEARPAMLGISGSGGGHLVICDGYDSYENTYHLSFGWNGVGDGWYSLPDGLPFGFNIIDAAIINIDSQSQGVNNTSHQDVIPQNYPNPFRSSTTISFNLATKSHENIPIDSKHLTGQAQINIYNVRGQLVRKLSIVNSQSSIVWDGKDERGKIVSSGIYLYQLSTRGGSASGGKSGDKVIDTKKCLLLK